MATAPPLLDASLRGPARSEALFTMLAQGWLEPLEALRAVVVHHSATPRAARFATLEAGHQRTGSVCIAYHHVILGDGSLELGRPLPLVGAHARGRNSDTIGLCIVGDNRFPEQRWADVQIEAARRYLDALELVAPGLELLGHRDVKATLCPGMPTAELRALLRPERPR